MPKPSLCSLATATRPRHTSSALAPPMLALTSFSPCVPAVTSTEPSVFTGSGLETYLIAPPMVFLPYRLPCGPRSTSIRLTSNTSSSAPCGRAT